MEALPLVPSATELLRSARQTRWSHTHAERLWEDHGSAVYALACALLGDEMAAKRAVVLGMTDFVDSHLYSSEGGTRRALARHVYWRSTDLTGQPPGSTGLPAAMAWIGQLARLQRACLALCVFGGHTYRDAADLLGVPPLAVARMLTSVLDELKACPHPASIQ